MRVLIVSFDRTLTEGLKNALSDHEVFTAKNSEEAIKMIPSDMDVVIYDAISGAISEEDINTLYTKKFSNSKYVILYDELFPVDPGNIIVPKKILVSRDEDPKAVSRKILEEPKEEVQTPEETKEVAEPKEVKEEAPPQPPPSGGKVLVVSFDQTLIDGIKGAVGTDLEVVSVKTVRQAIEQGKDAQVIVFDAISGIIAEKGLVDMSKDETMAEKPYVILVDDLFPINVEGIPLEKKYPISRDADPSQIKDLLLRALAESEEVREEEVTEQAEEAKERAEEVEEKPEEKPEEEKVEEIVEREIPQEIPEIEIEQVEEAPALEALEKIMEEKETYAQDRSEEAKAVEIPQEVEKVVREAVLKSLSEERIREIVAKVLEEKMEDIRGIVSEAVRSRIEKAFEDLDVKEIIRQTAYKALRDRLDELVT
jgi:hypothetical protein